MVSFPDLLFLAFLSTARIFAAFSLSLTFGVFYGYLAATRPHLESAMLFVLDVFQSLPVLGFFPAAIVFFITAFNGAGVELAAVFLIFTSQAWNLAFGVYEAIKSIPSDLIDASKSFGLNKWQLFKTIYLPASVPKLVYNSMISWSNSWYFLMACELISLGNSSYELKGIGSFLAKSFAQSDFSVTLLAILAMVFFIVVIDLFFWKPLLVWSRKFRYESEGIGQKKEGTLIDFLLSLPVIGSLISKIAQGIERIGEITEAKFTSVYYSPKVHQKIQVLKKMLLGLLVLLLAFGIAKTLFSLAGEFSSPLPSEAGLIPIALLYSFLRLVAAYVICLCVAFPVAYWISTHPEKEKFVMPVLEIVSAIPATAFIPIIVVAVLQFTGQNELPAIILLSMAMMWYVLFNLIGGMKSIPSELDEAAKSFRVKGWMYFTKILLPASIPSLVTGSVTAFGGGWNALIVAEYLSAGTLNYSVLGIGSLLNAEVKQGNIVLITLSVVAMSAAVLLLNAYVWKKLYAYSKKYFINA